MKLLPLVMIAVSTSTACAHADLTLVESVEGVGQSTQCVIKHRESKTRVDTTPGTSIIMDAAADATISLLPAQKRYLKAPAAVVKAAVERMQGNAAPSAPKMPELVSSGKMETVAGYLAQEYSASTAGGKITLWLTKDIPAYEEVMHELSAAFKDSPLPALPQNLGLDLARLPGFPMKAAAEVQPGQRVTTTLVSISVQPISPDTFEVPADYRPINRLELTPRAAVSKPTSGTP